MTTMNFSSIDTKSLNTLYNKTEELYKNIKEIRRSFKQDTLNGIEAFMQGMFGKSVKVVMLEAIFSELSQIKFTFDNSFNSSLTLDFEENEKTGKFEVKINNSFTYVDFDLTSDNNQDITKINVIYCLVKNIDNVKDYLVDKLKKTYYTSEKFNKQAKELMNELVEISKEIDNRKLIKNDNEIWNTIKNDVKLQNKYVIVRHTTRNTNIIVNEQNPVHIYSKPNTKTELKKELTHCDDEEIVKVSELSMLLH